MLYTVIPYMAIYTHICVPIYIIYCIYSETKSIWQICISNCIVLLSLVMTITIYILTKWCNNYYFHVMFIFRSSQFFYDEITTITILLLGTPKLVRTLNKCRNVLFILLLKYRYLIFDYFEMPRSNILYIIAYRYFNGGRPTSCLELRLCRCVPITINNNNDRTTIILLLLRQYKL